MAKLLTKVKGLFPTHWVKQDTFTRGWGFFFKQEAYNLSVLSSGVLGWHCFTAEWCAPTIAAQVAGVIVFRRYLAGGLCTNDKDLTGKTVVITGANGGMGFETARDMMKRGAHVIMACRNTSSGEEARKKLLGERGKAEVRPLDLSSLVSVRSFAEGIVKDNINVNILINNAGIMMCPYGETKEGFELQMGTNHLGHFLLTNLLLPQMKHQHDARIVNVSSLFHDKGKIDFNNFKPNKNNYNKLKAYGDSKLANVLFTRHLAKKLTGSNIQVFSLHPGVVYTKLGRHISTSFLFDWVMVVALKTTAEGAQTAIYCATEATQHPYMYFSDCAPQKPHTLDALDDQAAEKLWKVSSELVQLKQ